MISKSFSVMILAAGYGKRLKPITDTIPKPLVEVAGRTLLQNTIDFVNNFNCEDIVINTHYKHEMINEFIKKNYKQKNIILSHETTLLDTAGGVKNALSFFKNDTALILNSDIFWKNENIDDLKNFINNYKPEQKCKLLLVPKEKAHGIYSNSGDFNIVNGFLERYKQNQNILFYSGAQILSLDLFLKYQQQKFSFNLLWDDQIKNKLIFGDIMDSHWYHIGDIKGLKEAESSIS